MANINLQNYSQLVLLLLQKPEALPSNFKLFISGNNQHPDRGCSIVYFPGDCWSNFIWMAV